MPEANWHLASGKVPFRFIRSAVSLRPIRLRIIMRKAQQYGDIEEGLTGGTRKLVVRMEQTLTFLQAGGTFASSGHVVFDQKALLNVWEVIGYINVTSGL